MKKGADPVIIANMANGMTILSNFIVLEGLDGSGTTTQLGLLEKELASRGRKVYPTCEPTPLPTGRIIRDVLEKRLTVEPETLARLFSADRYEHLYGKGGIISRLEAGETVISDRYLFSSLTYQSLGCPFDLVKELNPFPLPEYLVYIDVSPEICRARRSTRDLVELFDGDSLQQSLAENYERAMAAYEGRGMTLIRIDGTRSPRDICRDILGALGLS